MQPITNIVLISPEIPWNVGAIGRTSVALQSRLIIIRPTIVDLSDKAVKRAGLDYWPYVNLKSYDSWQNFITSEKADADDLYFLSTKATKTLFQTKIKQNPYLIFGAESKGLPKFYHENYTERFFKMPMYGQEIRSLNLANTVTAVAYEAVRQLNFS